MKEAIRVLMLIVFVAGCATQYGKLAQQAEKSYQSRNFDSAVDAAASSLLIKPDLKKAQMVLKDAFPAAVRSHEETITQLKSSSAQFSGDETVSKREQVTKEYEALISLNSKVKNLPNLVDKKTKQPITFEFKDYGTSLAEARESLQKGQKDAAEMHYQEGLRLASLEGVDNSKAAAKHFKKAGEFVPNYKDAASRYEQSRKGGVKRMAISFEDMSGTTQYGAIGERITGQIIATILNDPEAREFLDLVARNKELGQIVNEQNLGVSGLVDEKTGAAVGNILGVQETLVGKITQIISEEHPVTRAISTEKASVVTGKETYTNKKGEVKQRNTYGDVFADVTVYTKVATAKITGSYQIIDAKTSQFMPGGSRSFEGNYYWSDTWATFEKDERALSSTSKALIAKPEPNAPSDRERELRAEQDLINSLASTLKSYAR